jgi:hypothetical protein
LSGDPLETPEADAEADYIPRVRSPGPYSRGGRPTVLTPPVKEEICKLLSIGLSRRQAAAWLDIDHSVISRLAAKDEDFARSITRAEELASVQPMMVMAAASRKNWRAAAWMLTHNVKREPVLTEEEKNQKVEEWLANKRRNMEYERRVAILEEEAKEAERERKREKEAAWDRAMEAKERAEREERRRRKAERLQKEAEGTS